MTMCCFPLNGDDDKDILHFKPANSPVKWKAEKNKSQKKWRLVKTNLFVLDLYKKVKFLLSSLYLTKL